MFLDMDKVQQLVADGYISVRHHPTAPLSIYNYTPQCQYEWKWTPETIACRGLILDDNDCVVARPFPKFFTPDQYKDLRNHMHHLYGVRYRDMYKGGFTVTEKMDGSLGILYYHPDCGLGIATRGSFTSDQALHATRLLRERYGAFPFVVDPACTYIFEIVYPDNRIVVDYRGLDDLILLTVLDNETAEDLPDRVAAWVKTGGLTVMEYDFKRFEDVLAVQAEDAEGFVVKFDNGIRVKVKFDEYLRLHRILTNTTSRTVWENLRNHVQMQDMLEVIPDEFYQWVTQVEDDLLTQYRAIEEEAENMVRACAAVGWIPNNRKAIAQHFKPSPVRGIMFSMIDGKDYEDTIWKMIKPKADKPFKVENNDETTCSNECPS